MSDTMITPKELAKAWQVDVETVYRLVKKGTLKGHKIGRSVRIARSEVDRYLESVKVEPTATPA